MSNCYTIYSAEAALPCSRAQFKKLSAILKADDSHGFDVEMYDSGVFLYAEECGSVDDLPKAALEILAQLMRDAKVPHLELGFASTSDKVSPGSHGGGAVRITSEGAIATPAILWD